MSNRQQRRNPIHPYLPRPEEPKTRILDKERKKASSSGKGSFFKRRMKRD